MLNKKSFARITENNFLINVGSEENISIDQLAKRIKRISGFKGKIVYHIKNQKKLLSHNQLLRHCTHFLKVNLL